MVQIIFATLSLIKDIHISVAFLEVRIMELDKDNWRKLRGLLQYLCGTTYMYLILSYDILNVIKWRVDSLYAVHGDMRGHNGAIMYLGCGS